MTLQAWLVSDEIAEQHVDACDTPACELCRSIYERWSAEARDAEKDNEPCNWSPFDEEFPSRA